MTDIIFGDRFILALWNLSINGSAAILAVAALRMLIKKGLPGTPGRLIVWLWAIPLFRLLCPMDISRWLGGLSLLPWGVSPLSVVNGRGMTEAAYQGVTLQLNTELAGIDHLFQQAMTGVLPAPNDATSIDPFQLWQAAAFWLWVIGAMVLLGATLWKYAKLNQSLQTATLVRSGLSGDEGWEEKRSLRFYRQRHPVLVYESDRIATAIVVGCLRCRIYLPVGLTPEEREWVLLHEISHIRRRDPLFKLAACAAVLLHWWNPLVWLSYRCIVRDLEIACDEQAIRLRWEQVKFGPGGTQQIKAGQARPESAGPELAESQQEKGKQAQSRRGGDMAEDSLRQELAAQYSKTLLRLSAAGSGLSSPLSFGESGVSQRIKSLLAKKTQGRVACAAVTVLLVIAAAALLSNPASGETPSSPGVRTPSGTGGERPSGAGGEMLSGAGGGILSGAGEQYTAPEGASDIVWELESCLRQLPQEITLEELARRGFVVESREGFVENGQQWDAFMRRFCEGYQPAEEAQEADSEQETDTARDANGTQPMGGPPDNMPEAGSLPGGESVLWLASSTIEGDWILEGLCATGDGYVLLADSSRDAFRAPGTPDISRYRFQHLTYKEQNTEAAPWFVFLTDEAPESFSYEDYMQRSGLSSVSPVESPIEAFILAGGWKHRPSAE